MIKKKLFLIFLENLIFKMNLKILKRIFYNKIILEMVLVYVWYYIKCFKLSLKIFVKIQ